ncbi:MAG: glutaminase, partial [Salinivirgaceae bacterium]|nr:glutaminase [Salinivirgaceae bacterium]
MDYNAIIETVYKEILPYIAKGKIADYIPMLAKIDPNKFGFAMRTNNGEEYTYGDSNDNFSVQSISKLLT